jgi:XTP/dITP diphosphohydrolase
VRPSPRRRLVLASANPKKVAELADILGESCEVVPRPAEVPDVVEDGATLVANARLKAVAIAEAVAAPAVADDTGLEVDALGGAPGVRSARYAGEPPDDAANVAKLLAALDGVPDGERTARFRTVIVVAWPDGHEVVTEGVAEGRIVGEPRGAGGFGYDPVFVPEDGDGRTFAEMDAATKHTISHRGRALRSLVEVMAGDRWPDDPSAGA